MQQRRFRLVSTLLLATVLAMAGTLAYAQGSVTTTLSGTVTDTSGGVIPGADVTVKNNATAAVFTGVTDERGTFTIPALPPGTYTVTVALMGFKTWSAPDIVLNAAVPASLKAQLQVGQLEETVVVEGSAQLVQTQTSAVATTLNSKAISNLPISRAAFDVVLLTPGVNTSDGSLRDSTVNGLPQSATNITLDGMNIQDNYAKTWDGMFTRVSPRIDAVEEVTVGTAAQGADMGGQGAVQIKFVTRSGTNQFRGSGYYYWRRQWMNTNTWWNLNYNVKTTGEPTQKGRVFQDQPGFRLGGPIWKDKAFFFVNYEWISSPGTLTSNRTIMSPLSQQGIFQYNGQQVDLLALAAKFNQTSTIDPNVAKILADIRATTSKGTLNTSATDPLVDTLSWQQPTSSKTTFPTVRLDYNLSSKHRVSASLTQNHLLSDPDTTNSYYAMFPGFPVHGTQDSYRWTAQLSLRSTLTPNMVNEVRLGGTGGATLFAPDTVVPMYSEDPANMNGYRINISAFKSISNPSNLYTNSAREGATRVVEDTLSYIKGAHSISTGFGYTLANVWLRNQNLVPNVTFGMVSGDPADSLMFNSTNFPGISSADLGYARNLYSVLTGRITTIDYLARIAEDGTQYVVSGPSMAKGNLPDLGIFVQDSWRWKPNFTVNAGLRYTLQKPFYSLNNSYSMATMDALFGKSGLGTGFVPGQPVTGLGNLFQPGANAGSATQYTLLSANTPAYNTDKNNFAPSIGVAWKIGADTGWRHTLLSNDAVLRAGYNISYQRGGMSDFTEVFGTNPGLSLNSMTRSRTNGNLGALPVLLRDGNTGPGPFSVTRTYPMSVPSASSSVYSFDPNITVPWASSFTVGMQRAITKNMAGEIRFVHTGSHGTWSLNNVAGAYNYNEVNIVENGFLDEFKLAQQNLIANQGKSFAYKGPGTGTYPLPILLGWLNGKTTADQAAAYSGTAWSQSSYLAYLYSMNPNPNSLASSLRSDATYKANAANAGMPANFFVVNPDVNNAYLATNGPDTRYNGIQLILTRRFAQGLQLSANYGYGRGYQNAFYGFHKPFVETLQNYSNLTAGGGAADHNFNLAWVYELPFGQGKRWGGGVGRNLNRIIGNWSYQGTARIQSGRLIDFGNVRMVGFTEKDLQGMMNLRFTKDPTNSYRTIVFDLPQDVIDNTVKAFSFDYAGYTKGTPTGRYFMPANGPDCIESTPGYGDCGARSLIVNGPLNMRFDMSFSKDILVTSRVGIRFDVQIFNVFNRVNFTPNVYTGSTADSYRVTGSTDSSRTGQMAFRVTW